MYQHGAIVHNDGAGMQRVRVKEAVYHVVKSEMFQKLLKGELFDESFSQLRGRRLAQPVGQDGEGMDVTGEAHAAKVPASHATPTSDDQGGVPRAALQLHPDKVGATTDDEKAAEAKFREVQEAYELLKARRKK